MGTLGILRKTHETLLTKSPSECEEPSDKNEDSQDGLFDSQENPKSKLEEEWEYLLQGTEEDWAEGNFLHFEHIYLTQQGIDWKKAYELKSAYEEAKAAGGDGIEERSALHNYLGEFMTFYEEDMNRTRSLVYMSFVLCGWMVFRWRNTIKNTLQSMVRNLRDNEL